MTQEEEPQPTQEEPSTEVIPVPGRLPSFYTRRMRKAAQDLRKEVEWTGEITRLRDPDLSEELVTSRIIVAEMLADPELSNANRLRALTQVTRIARMAKMVQELDNAAIRKDFLQAVITAVTFSFHRANMLLDPAERARVFAREFAQLFPETDSTGNMVEGELVAQEE